jgi:hypothetical protein
MRVHEFKHRALLLWRECLLHNLKKPLGILTIGFFCVFFVSTVGIYRLTLLSTQQPETTENFTITNNSASETNIVVDVQGAVERPGIYEVPEGTRLIELLQKTQGLSSKADKYQVAKTFNLSKKLTDEEKIYIPFIEER